MQPTKCEYTHHLPYSVRSHLCNLLDADQSWRNLGGRLGLDGTQLNLLGQAIQRLNGSPANELLNKLDSSNIRVYDLCKFLSEIGHWRAVELLQPFDIRTPNGFVTTSSNLQDANSTTLVTPTPSFLNCKDSNTFVESKMDLLSFNGFNGQISTTWISNEKLAILSAPETSLQDQQEPKPICHKQQQQELLDNQQLNYFNSSPKKHQCEEDKFKKAHTTNRPRTSLTDDKIVDQLRLIMQINYSELKAASDDFSSSNIIGNGGFASVYRGNLKGTEVAIKRLKCNLVDQALNELTIMNTYRIDNILPIYGISIDGPEACLIYQYMSNGSLEDRLLCKNNSGPLSWRQRACIGRGIAKGLHYLHTLRDKPLVHGDVKSANILLDGQFVPKLGDFGLSRQVFKGIKGKEMLTHCTVSSVNGTQHYLPSEYLRHRILSPAVDVYSYGIVLLEMGTGKRAFDGKRLLIDRVQDEMSSISSGDYGVLRDNRLEDDTDAGLKIWDELMIKLGLECAHKIKKKRLDMNQVLERYSTFERENSERLVANQTIDTNGFGHQRQAFKNLFPPIKNDLMPEPHAKSMRQPNGIIDQVQLDPHNAFANANQINPIQQPFNPANFNPITENPAPNCVSQQQQLYTNTNNQYIPDQPMYHQYPVTTQGYQVDQVHGMYSYPNQPQEAIANLQFDSSIMVVAQPNQNFSNANQLNGQISQQQVNSVHSNTNANQQDPHQYDTMLPDITELNIQMD